MRDSIEFSGNFGEPVSEQPKRTVHKGLIAIVKPLIIMLVIMSLAGGGFFLYSHKPELLQDLVLKIDRFGLTSIGKLEQQRIASINQLPITYAEKQVLINRTVFLGATPEMVILALGKPKKHQYIPASGQQPSYTTYIYHFAKDPKPTVLRFRDNQLTQAQRASTIDVSNR